MSTSVTNPNRMNRIFRFHGEPNYLWKKSKIAQSRIHFCCKLVLYSFPFSCPLSSSFLSMIPIWNYQKPGGLRSLKLGRLGINRTAPNDVNMYSFKSQMALLLVCERIWFLLRNYPVSIKKTFCECDEIHILLYHDKIAQPKAAT